MLLDALARAPNAPTTISEPAEALDWHIADSLSGLKSAHLGNARRIADLGAGAGFPGLALAVALPEAQVDLIESTRRKCEVIAALAAATGLSNARAIPARAEEWAALEGAGAYDVVTARALASLPVLVEYAAPLLEAGGVLVAWKGARDPKEERAGAVAADLVGMRPVEVIGVRPFRGSRERALHVYTKEKPTPERFPRRPGMATKRPLGD
jgi:16S rRNA (guanine527-N7)-methyltransferase